MARIKIDGYGQLELNQVAFRRDGRIEAQCALDTDVFSAEKPAENGMILAVDNVTRTIKMPDGKLPVALNYTAEHMYDDRANALKDFKLTPEDGFYPRLGYLAVGDKFTTNCLSSDELADEEAIESALEDIETTPIYGTTSSDGSIKISTTEPGEGLVLKVIHGPHTMPDGQLGLRFQVMSV